MGDDIEVVGSPLQFQTVSPNSTQTASLQPSLPMLIPGESKKDIEATFNMIPLKPSPRPVSRQIPSSQSRSRSRIFHEQSSQTRQKPRNEYIQECHDHLLKNLILIPTDKEVGADLSRDLESLQRVQQCLEQANHAIMRDIGEIISYKDKNPDNHLSTLNAALREGRELGLRIRNLLGTDREEAPYHFSEDILH